MSWSWSRSASVPVCTPWTTRTFLGKAGSTAMRSPLVVCGPNHGGCSTRRKLYRPRTGNLRPDPTAPLAPDRDEPEEGALRALRRAPELEHAEGQHGELDTPR